MKKLIKLIILLFILILSIILYSKYLGTKGIKVKEYPIYSTSLESNFDGLKVVYISDLLYGSTTNINTIKELVTTINILKPDLVLYGGNFISKNYNITNKEEITKELSKINSTLGKYFVMGYNDTDIVNTILTESNFIYLNNTNELIYNKTLNPICLVGISSYLLGNYDLNTINNCTNYYTIVFTHEPDIIKELSNYNINLILSGNSLGGLIKLPIYNELYKFEGSTTYYKEYYNINNIEIYISNGLGTTNNKKLRLFNKPSINFFRLYNE